MALDTRFRDGDDAFASAGFGSCGWLESAPEAPPIRRLEGEEQADCVVLGAGFTGLAAARRLATLRPRWRVVVLDAQRAGDGASGRSSGFVVDAASFIAAKRSADADRFVRLSRLGIAALAERVRDDRISCDWDDRGWFHAAATEAGAASLDTLEGWLEGRGVPFEDLDRSALAERVGTSHYRRGLLLPGSVMVQAGALVRGLAGSLPGNVELYEHSAVQRIRPGYSVEAVSGTVQSPRLIAALNAWMPRMGLLRNRVFPLVTFGSLTRPLAAEELARTGRWTTWGILAQDPLGPSVRKTVDGRLLIRSEVRYEPRVRATADRRNEARRCHQRALALRFPELGDVPFETTWAGAMGTVPNQAPFFGLVDSQAVAVAGFTGAGIAMGTALGALAADLLCGENHPSVRDARALERPRWLPPEPFRSLGIRVKLARMNAGAAG